jgi:hypothetical protein
VRPLLGLIFLLKENASFGLINNPTKSKSVAVNDMIRATAVHEVRGSGVKPNARGAFEWEEFMSVLLATH